MYCAIVILLIYFDLTMLSFVQINNIVVDRRSLIEQSETVFKVGKESRVLFGFMSFHYSACTSGCHEGVLQSDAK